jgi:cell division protein FtsB
MNEVLAFFANHHIVGMRVGDDSFHEFCQLSQSQVGADDAYQPIALIEGLAV